MVKGYIVVHCPKHPNLSSWKMIGVHRLVIENKLGRYLSRYELVHHINGNKTDNRIENLQVMSISEHRKLHSKDNIYKKGFKKHNKKINEVLKLRKKGMFAIEISKITGIPRRTIQRYIIGNGRKIVLKRAIRDKNGRFFRLKNKTSKEDYGQL